MKGQRNKTTMNTTVPLILSALKERLDQNNVLLIQDVGGSLLETKLIFNPPATEHEINQFFNEININVPNDFKSFLLLHNGARIFTEIRLFGLEDIYRLYIQHDYKSMLPEGWLPIGDDTTGYKFYIDTTNIKNDKDYPMYHSEFIGGDKKINLTFEK